jgi:hypothetical protein
MKEKPPTSRRGIAYASVVFAVGISLFFATTKKGMILIQLIIGVGGPFSIGNATISPDENWLLVDVRLQSGDPHMKLGIFPSDKIGVPSGRFYSFRDVSFEGYITFIELDTATTERVSKVWHNDIQESDCRRLERVDAGRLVQCMSPGKPALVYDLDRLFVAVVSPPNGELVEHVLDVVGN